MWSYDDLSIVNEVIKQGSFINASKKLNIPSSTISRRVSEFESALGVRLLERNSRKLSLTDKGELLFRQCNAQMQQIKEAIQEITSDNTKPTGVLKVTAPVTLGNELLKSWFCDFARINPEINLNIILSNHYEDILDDSFDVAIRVGPLKDSEFIAQFLFTTEFVLCASKAYLAKIDFDIASQVDLKALSDLQKHDFLSYQQSKNLLKLEHQTNSKNVELKVNTRMEATSTAILRQAAIDGLGIACLPVISIKEQIESGELIHIFKDFAGFPKKEIFAVYPSKKHLSQKMRVFLDYLKERAKTVYGD